MARRKKSDEPTAAINFRCPADVKVALEDLAHLSRQDVSTLLVAVCRELVAANEGRISAFRRAAAR